MKGAAVLALLTACGAPALPAPPVPPVASTHHAQIVRAMTTPQRRALVARFVERNGADWEVNDAALAMSTTVVDPFAGFLRRSRSTAMPPRAAVPVTPDVAVVAARAFVKKNADLLGVPHHVVPTLADHLRLVKAEDHVNGRAVWVVELESTFASKGYESFRELDNKVAIDVFIGDDGAACAVANLSEIHPRLLLDTKPVLGSDDDWLYAHLVGRRLFALDANDAQVQLGNAERGDFSHAQLVVFASPGPMMAWITYRLAWGVGMAKWGPEGAPTSYFFTWVVDADSGEVLADAVPPRVAEGP